MGFERSSGLRKGKPALADSPLNGETSDPECPRRTLQRGPGIPVFPPGGRPLQITISELGNQLRPDRDHPDEQRDRRQRRRFFHEYLQHSPPPVLEHIENIVPFLF
jgi:hypothetical protein